MTLHLVSSNPRLDQLIRQTPKGMMFWSGTCSDPDATCGGCEHYGYTTVTRNAAGNTADVHRYPASCALYQKHTGQHGDKLSKNTPACKYFYAKRP
jgi:hypothetical protein